MPQNTRCLPKSLMWYRKGVVVRVQHETRITISGMQQCWWEFLLNLFSACFTWLITYCLIHEVIVICGFYVSAFVGSYILIICGSYFSRGVLRSVYTWHTVLFFVPVSVIATVKFTLTDRMGSGPCLSIKHSVTTDTIYLDGYGDGTCKEVLSRVNSSFGFAFICCTLDLKMKNPSNAFVRENLPKAVTLSNTSYVCPTVKNKPGLWTCYF